MRNLTQVEGMSLDVLRHGIALGVRDLSRVHGATARAAAARSTSPLTSATRRPHLRDGRRRIEARGHRGRDRADAGARARGHASRRGGLRQQHAPGAQRRGRPADAFAAGRRATRCARWSSAMGAVRPRRLHADQGRADAGAVSRVARRRQRPPGDDRRAAAQQHQSARGVRRPRRDRRRQRARPSAHRPGVVLPADDGLHDAVAVSGRGAGELEARARPARRCAARACSPAGRFATACAPNWQPPPTFRLFNGEWDKVHVVEAASARPRALRAASHRRHRTQRAPRPARRDARSGGRQKTCRPCSPRSCSTPTRKPSAACSTIRTASSA